MSKKLRALVASTIVALGLATGASAATITYTNSAPTPKLQLVIDDAASPGKFRFSLSTTVGTADYLGLGFNFAGAGIMQSDITLISATRADDTAITPSLQLFGNNTGSQSDCGAGCNFNGGGSASLFDYIIRIGSNGGNANNFVKTVVFDIMVPGSLAANPFSQLAARAQSTTNPGGSIKADLTPDNPPNPGTIPLPAGLPLLASGFLAFGFLHRRRKA